MANTIQLKRGTGSSEPSSLAEGELAINLDSGKLFYGSGSSVSSDFTVNKLTAETYVVSSSVTHMTTSFSSGSTAFGDSAGDTHTFTGAITASGNISSSGTITGNSIVGTLGTPAQTNITSVGSLSALTVSGDATADKYHADLGNSKGYGLGATSTKPILHLNAAGDPLCLGAAHSSYHAAGVNIYTTGSDSSKGLFLDSVGNMTASGDISASGTISSEHFYSSDDIVAAGDISASAGNVYGQTVNTPRINAEGNTNLYISSGIQVIGDITGSGNISSSGNIYATDYFDNGTNISSIYQPTLTFGIADTNVLRADANVVDDDFLRVNGTSIEGRSAAQVLSDIGAQPASEALVAQDLPTDGAFLIADDGRAMADSVLSQAGTVVSSTGHISSSTNIYAADYFDDGANINTIYSPIASPTFTGTVAIPNIANVETAITANTAKATNVSTNLTATTHASQITINSSDGDNVVIAEASDTIAGVMSVAHHDKLDGIEAGATADQTNAQIAAAVEAASDSNTFTDADHSKLNGIEASATADQTQADINGLAITTVGALGSGTIASGFGNIDNGTSTIDTGEITATSIKHSISGNNAGDYGPGAEILYGISSTNVTAGAIYTLRSGVWTLIDANYDNRVYNLCAVATIAAGTGNSGDGMIIKGCVTLASAYTAGSDAAGIPVYASETGGKATLTAPSDSGDLVRILGYSLDVSDKKMFFNPDSTFVEIA